MLIQRDPPVNFVQILLEIRHCPSRVHKSKIKRSRFSFGEMEAALGVSKNTIKGWFYKGAEPHFEDGRALLKLHAELTQQAQGKRT
jgi:hypothetical protein